MDWINKEGFLDIRETADAHLCYSLKYNRGSTSKNRTKAGIPYSCQTAFSPSQTEGIIEGDRNPQSGVVKLCTSPEVTSL